MKILNLHFVTLKGTSLRKAASYEPSCVKISLVVFSVEDGIRDLVRSRGLGDVYKRQGVNINDTVKLADRKNHTL